MIYWVALGVLAALTLGTKALLASKFGTIIQAIRDDPERARFLGYNVAAYQVTVFTISGVIAALAGIVWVMIVQYVSPTSLEIFFSITMVIWAAVGGRLSLFGASFRRHLHQRDPELCGRRVPAAWFVILGTIFIVVVRFLPKGLAGLFEMIIGLIPYRGRAPVQPTLGARRAAD